jgi:hypothetical protein
LSAIENPRKLPSEVGNIQQALAGDRRRWVIRIVIRIVVRIEDRHTVARAIEKHLSPFWTGIFFLRFLLAGASRRSSPPSYVFCLLADAGFTMLPFTQLRY